MEVACELADGIVLAGTARDLSMGGMFIECETVPPFGSQVIIAGRFPGETTQSRLPAVLRWCKPGGFGVQFGLLGARETYIISQLIRQH
jgi:hypothetical protein